VSSNPYTDTNISNPTTNPALLQLKFTVGFINCNQQLCALLDTTGVLLEALRKQLLQEAGAGGLGQGFLQNHGLPQQVLHLHHRFRIQINCGVCHELMCTHNQSSRRCTSTKMVESVNSSLFSLAYTTQLCALQIDSIEGDHIHTWSFCVPSSCSQSSVA